MSMRYELDQETIPLDVNPAAVSHYAANNMTTDNILFDDLAKKAVVEKLANYCVDVKNGKLEKGRRPNLNDELPLPPPDGRTKFHLIEDEDNDGKVTFW